LDDTDEESTIWDAVDEVLICGKGEMIKTLANACYHHGIPKKNIHFELFEEFNDDIYPVEKEFPLIENIEVEFTMLGKNIQLSFLITEIRSCNSFVTEISCSVFM
jgi:ring-1,2-phenylacetyl-CoA epoxidase subunit PaaE